MRERIQQLKEQAMEWVPNRVDPDTKIRLLNAEKFAELIVEECCNIVDNYGRFLTDEALIKKIKRDLGVKE